MNSPSILMVGAGAIGAFFGSALARQGARVSVVSRSDYERVASAGYSIRSPLLGDHVFKPHAVLRSVAECATPPDYVVLTVKVLEGEDRAALIRPAVGPQTVIWLIQNGVDIEPEIATAFPDNELLSSLAFIGVSRTGPGEIHHQSSGSLTLGRYPSGITPAAQRVAKLLQDSGVPCRTTDDVVTARWQKAMWNAVFNPLSILGGVLDTTTMLGSESARDFVRACMQEVCAIAAANGHPLPPELIDQLITATQAMPNYKTSMALDFEQQRPLELTAILGNTLRAAHDAGVDAPRLASLYAIAQMVLAKRAATAV